MDWLEWGSFPQPLSHWDQGDVRGMEKERMEEFFQELCRKSVHGKVLMDEGILLPLTASDPREDFPGISLTVVGISSAPTSEHKPPIPANLPEGNGRMRSMFGNSLGSGSIPALSFLLILARF